jgi:type II secretory pathway component PulF
MFRDLGLRLPAATQVVFRASDAARGLLGGADTWILLIAVGLGLAALIGLRGTLGAARWRQLMGTVPMVGPLWMWTGAAQFSRMLAVLVDHGVPLTAALELTAAGARDPNVRHASLRYASGVEQGSPLSELLAAGGQLPATLVPFVRWGERSGQLASGLRTASEMYEERLRLRVSLLRSVLPAVVFIFVSLAVALCVVALAVPMLSLINALF